MEASATIVSLSVTFGPSSSSVVQSEEGSEAGRPKWRASDRRSLTAAMLRSCNRSILVGIELSWTVLTLLAGSPDSSSTSPGRASSLLYLSPSSPMPCSKRCLSVKTCVPGARTGGSGGGTGRYGKRTDCPGMRRKLLLEAATRYDRVEDKARTDSSNMAPTRVIARHRSIWSFRVFIVSFG